MHIIKISGNELHKPDYVAAFAEAIGMMDEPTVIVNGGGKGISEMQELLDLPTRKVDGLRITDAPTLKATEMVMSGQVNKLLTRALLNAGVQAIGLSGVDGRLLQCHPKQHPTIDLGYVGTIHTVNASLLNQLLDIGLTVVLSPISIGDDGQTYNVNADEAATAVAHALNATLLSFVSNVPGVLENGRLLPTLTPQQSDHLIYNGTITDGMIPKIHAVQHALAAGIPETRILDLAGLQNGGGTRFLSE